MAKATTAEKMRAGHPGFLFREPHAKQLVRNGVIAQTSFAGCENRVSDPCTQRNACCDSFLAKPHTMNSHKITATSYHDLKSQLYPWDSNPRIKITTPEADIAKALATARNVRSQVQEWKVDLTLHYRAV